ncbi:MAG: DUF928 domain-containing protein, partial [Leptolyngbya sp. SIO4C5]|nr:DUF928 domain-containing protein [Leptolyngbya sp. SIO4C5]
MALSLFVTAVQVSCKFTLEKVHAQSSSIETLQQQGEQAYQSGEAAHSAMQYEQALEHYQQALGLYKQASDQLAQERTLNRIGDTYLHLEEYNLALSAYQQALELRQALANNRLDASTSASNSAENQGPIAFQNPDIDTPPVIESGFQRGGTLFDLSEEPFLSVVPIDTKHGLTVGQSPILFIHLPELPSSAHAVLSISDVQQLEYYEFEIESLPTESGIVAIALDEQAEFLQQNPGKDYYWLLQVQFNNDENFARSPERSRPITGSIRYVEPGAELVERLAANSIEHHAAIYAEAGLWYDALAVLFKLQQSQPNNLSFQQQWRSLLVSVGLSEIENAALLPLLEATGLNSTEPSEPAEAEMVDDSKPSHRLPPGGLGNGGATLGLPKPPPLGRGVDGDELLS